MMEICKDPSAGLFTELLSCPAGANSLHAGCNRAGCTAGLTVPRPLPCIRA